MANEQFMPLISNRCGKDKLVATILESQFFAEFRNGHGEIAYRDIGTCYTFKNSLQFAFIHRGRLFYDETTTREIRNIRIRYKQMTISVKLLCPKPLCQQFKAPRLHNGGIRLEEKGENVKG